MDNTWVTKTSPVITYEYVVNGCAPIEIVKLMEAPCDLSHLAKKWRKPYTSKYDKVESELKYIVSCMENGGKSITIPKVIDDYKKVVYDICGGDTYKEKYEKLLDHILIYCLQLDYLYNRPRPHVLAPYFNIKINPKMSEWIILPAYPNPFIVGAKVILTCEKESNLKTKVTDASAAFVRLGWSYPSDNIAAYEVADMITADTYFKEKIQPK